MEGPSIKMIPLELQRLQKRLKILDDETSPQSPLLPPLATGQTTSTTNLQSLDLENGCGAKNKRCKMTRTLLLAVAVIVCAFLGLSVLVGVLASKSQTAQTSTCSLALGGGNFTPSDEVSEVPGQCSCPGKVLPTSPLPKNLTGHTLIATPGRIIVAGGTDGRDHDPRKVFYWESQSKTWMEMASFNIPRISACMRVEGTIVTVWGGRQGSNPEKPPCHLSSIRNSDGNSENMIMMPLFVTCNSNVRAQIS